jgi:DNA segregation ATPase FtsK/SpoIIIE, S-DNA-T family
MSGDPHEGPLLGGHKAAPLPAGRGLLVGRRRPAVLVQVAHCPPGGPQPAGAGVAAGARGR